MGCGLVVGDALSWAAGTEEGCNNPVGASFDIRNFNFFRAVAA